MVLVLRTGYEPGGREFESLRARQIKKGSFKGPFFILCVLDDDKNPFRPTPISAPKLGEIGVLVGLCWLPVVWIQIRTPKLVAI